jgi:hypothetical protein
MHVGAVIAVTDLDRAQEFYEGHLGLAGAPTPGGWLVRGDAGSVAAWLRDPDGSVLTIFTAPRLS